MRVEHFYSLSSRLVLIKGQDDVNPEDAEKVGAAIHETLDNLAFIEAKNAAQVAIFFNQFH